MNNTSSIQNQHKNYELKQRERLKKILENHCAVADCKAYSQDCTAEDCASCLADHILADGWMRPPCKVGDTVYVVSHFRSGILERKVEKIIVDKDGIMVDTGYAKIDVNDFGKTVFLTKEAVNALGGVQG